MPIVVTEWGAEKPDYLSWYGIPAGLSREKARSERLPAGSFWVWSLDLDAGEIGPQIKNSDYSSNKTSPWPGSLWFGELHNLWYLHYTWESLREGYSRVAQGRVGDNLLARGKQRATGGFGSLWPFSIG